MLPKDSSRVGSKPGPGWTECECHCHRVSGVRHVMACCQNGWKPPLFPVSEDKIIEELAEQINSDMAFSMNGVTETLDRFLDRLEKSEQFPEVFTAIQARWMGVQLPPNIPDHAWVLRSSVIIEQKNASVTSNGMFIMDYTVQIKEPFKWSDDEKKD